LNVQSKVDDLDVVREIVGPTRRTHDPV
jgi:hypothetical protein